MTAMNAPNNLSVRKYTPADREAVRRIACETSFFEKSELFVEDKEIVADALTIYFTDFEPESCFVAVHQADVVGYLTGTRSAQRMVKIFNSRIIWRLLFKAIRRRLIFKTSFLKFILNFCVSFLKGEFQVPGCSDKYQALYHINIDKEFRSRGLGGRLVKDFENYLMDNHVYNVRVGTMSDEGKEFFPKNGYQVLFKSQRSYLKYKLNRIIPFYVLGKNLNKEIEKPTYAHSLSRR